MFKQGKKMHCWCVEC